MKSASWWDWWPWIRRGWLLIFVFLVFLFHYNILKVKIWKKVHYLGDFIDLLISLFFLAMLTANNAIGLLLIWFTHY
jgi:hypothetical protein